MPKLKKKTKSSNVLKFSFTETLIQLEERPFRCLLSWLPEELEISSTTHSGLVEVTVQRVNNHLDWEHQMRFLQRNGRRYLILVVILSSSITG